MDRKDLLHNNISPEDSGLTILLAPDSFKGSFSSLRFCQIAKSTINQLLPQAQVISCPMSDGGEGWLACYQAASQINCERLLVDCVDAWRRPIQAPILVFQKHSMAVIESATCVGLHLLEETERRPLQTSSHGLGILIKSALQQGCSKIIVGLGGTASNDAGAGMLQELGVRFKDSSQSELSRVTAADLAKISSVDWTNVHPELKDCSLIAACDVAIPLFGPQGASLVYSPQKGASQSEAKELDACLQHFWQMTNRQAMDQAGAAGGLAYGLSLLGAKLQSGAEWLLDLWQIDQHLAKGCDLLITGEGQLDQQTGQGKLISRLALRSQNYRTPCIALCGRVPAPTAEIPGLTAAFTLNPEIGQTLASDCSVADGILNLVRTFLAARKIADDSQPTA